jgi:mRNA interferase RelE/StbE
MPLLFVSDALDGIPQKEKETLLRRIDWLWINRMMITHHPLHGDLAGFYKRRVGNYRIIYTYDNPVDEMVIHLVGHRDSIYQSI